METIAKKRLWTVSFFAACASNFPLFVSLYMFLPVFPAYLVNRFSGVSFVEAGGVIALFSVGMFLSGPFYSYLIDRYKRKVIYLFAYLIVISMLAGYSVVGTLLWMAMLRFIQGAFFGVATTMGSTLAIDVTTSERRNDGNSRFCWAGRLGIAFGPMIGVLLISQGFSMQIVLYASIIFGLLGLVFTSFIHVSFRAPLGAKVFSSDRFILSRAWVEACNLILVAVIFGMLLSTINEYATSVNLQNFLIRFFGFIGVGFLLAMLADKFAFTSADYRARVVSGLICILAAVLLLMTRVELASMVTAALLGGLGFGLVASDFLLMFVGLSNHCKRGTANNFFMLTWELGVAIGIILGCMLINPESCYAVFHLAIILSIVSLLMFLFITASHFNKRRLR